MGSHIHTLLADGIDVPYALMCGLGILVPLMLFEVTVEAWVLQKVWRIDFKGLCRFTLVSNTLSLLAGIPVLIINSVLYDCLLPNDLPGYFDRYPMVMTLGSLIYFIVTLMVEGVYAFLWLDRHKVVIAFGQVWKGVLLANLATYAVLAPLNYYLNRPAISAFEFTRNTSWSSPASSRVFYTDPATGNLQKIRLDGSGEETIIPRRVEEYLVGSGTETIIPGWAEEYLVSADANLGLFQETNDNFYLYRRDTGESKLVDENGGISSVKQMAFSPSGKYVAFGDTNNNQVQVVNLETRQRFSQSLAPKLILSADSSVIWSTNEMQFYVSDGGETNELVAITILGSKGALLVSKLTDTISPPVFPCFGRIGSYCGFDFIDDGDRHTYFNHDFYGDLHIFVDTGSSAPANDMKIFREGPRRTQIQDFSIGSGKYFRFSDVAILDGGNKCLFDVNGIIYLWDMPGKRVGTLVKGEKFFVLTPKYQKKF